MDQFSPNDRSKIMSRIRSKNSKPELVVRRLVHSLGYRYRLHSRSLPGSPDLVFPKYRKVIFVHGCFWHRHSCRKGKSIPTTRRDFWESKLEANRLRDVKSRRQLNRLGWGVMVVWECQTGFRKLQFLTSRIVRFLEGEK